MVIRFLCNFNIPGICNNTFYSQSHSYSDINLDFEGMGKFEIQSIKYLLRPWLLRLDIWGSTHLVAGPKRIKQHDILSHSILHFLLNFMLIHLLSCSIYSCQEAVAWSTTSSTGPCPMPGPAGVSPIPECSNDIRWWVLRRWKSLF